ncbi:hypothetical protein Tco_0906949 [Tanacetum coccineum]|uniref:Uncharacterized protein n=1 Tax=Tanacetum coccineum TaxID=301880 RepID=A0ABQ5CIZ2_9ASTR
MMKAASYPDFGLELLVPERMWIDDVCTYDISAKYGISHWWFNRQKFYIDRHDSLSCRKEVRTHMQILSVNRIKAYSRYGYDYLSKIVLRRDDFQEHMIAKKDFKNLYPSDFEDLNRLLLQGYEFKHDYTIIESPRVIVFLVDNNDRNIMRFNKIYKFSDGTLTRILEALDYRVMEFKSTTVTRVANFDNNTRGFKFEPFANFSARKFSETEDVDVIGTVVSISYFIPFNSYGVDKIRRTLILKDYEFHFLITEKPSVSNSIVSTKLVDTKVGTLHKEINTVNLIVGADPTIRLRRERDVAVAGTSVTVPRLQISRTILGMHTPRNCKKVIEEQAARDLLILQTLKKKSPADQFIFQRRTPMSIEPSGIVESPSMDAELAMNDSETESDEEVPPAGSNPGNAAEFQPQTSHVVHAGPNRKHMGLEITDALTQQNTKQMDDEFTTTAYPNVQENLKLPTKDLVIIEEPEEEPEKTHTESEVQSMVTVPIHQDTSSVPPMTSRVIDLTVSHPVSTTIHAPLLTSTTTVTTTTTTTSLPPPPPQLQESTTDPILVGQTWVLAIVIDAVDWAMQAPLRAHFRNLLTVDMKEILQQRMFEDKSYEAHEDHKNLYDALQKSLERDYSNQLLADLDEARKKKRKRRESPRTPPGSPHSQPPPPAGASGAPGTSGASGSSQLPLPPPPPSTGTSGSAQQQGSKAPSSSKTAASTHQSMAWTTSDTRYESTGFTATQETSPSDDLMQDDSILDEQVHLSDDDDSGNDHPPKDNLRKDWWKPLPEEDRPATPEPAWTIPSSNVSDVENNWASALVSTYEPPAENSLLAKIGDMTTFMNWYCQKVNKTVLTQADFEGQAYEVVKAFYPDVIHLQFQMEECHKMLTDQVDWTNPEGDQVRVDVNRPLPLGGPPGHVTIQTQFFFNKDLEYLRYGSKGSSPALSISKMKAASYPDFGVELLVPEQMWIHDVCTYDISAKYGISH